MLHGQMYNKLFTKILDSSIWLEPVATRIVWITLLAAMDKDGYAHFSAIENLAIRARVTTEECDTAVTCLSSPDPNSEDPGQNGRRIERVPGGFIILNAMKYAGMLNTAVVREQTRLRVEKHRKLQSERENSVTQPLQPVTETLPPVTPVSVSVVTSVPVKGECEGETVNVSKKFKPPSFEEVKLAGAKSGLPFVQAESFFNYYESNGWKVGKNPMKSWLAALAGWRTRWEANRAISSGSVKQSVPIYTQKTTLEEKIKSLLVDSYIDDQWVKRPKPGHEDEVRSLRAKLREIEAKIISA